MATRKAAVQKSRERAYLALVANPLVPDATVARALLDDLVERGIV